MHTVTLYYTEEKCEEVCGALVRSFCLTLLTDAFHNHLRQRGVNVQTTVTCGSVVATVHGELDEILKAVDILTEGCINLTHFRQLCGPFEVQGVPYPTITPTEMPSQIPSSGPSSLPSKNPSSSTAFFSNLSHLMIKVCISNKCYTPPKIKFGISIFFPY